MEVCECERIRISSVQMEGKGGHLWNYVSGAVGMETEHRPPSSPLGRFCLLPRKAEMQGWSSLYRSTYQPQRTLSHEASLRTSASMVASPGTEDIDDSQ